MGEADPGDTIELEWQSSGGVGAYLYGILPSGQFPQQGWEVDATGVYTYGIDPGERNTSGFFLYVYDDAQRGIGAYLSVKLRCPVPWFFAPAPDVCPTDPILSNAAEEHFEHGTMIWIKDKWSEWVEEEGWVFVLYDDQINPKWQVFADEWDESKPERDPTLTPPPDRHQPVRGFGWVWRQHADVRVRLGWAVDQETGFGTVIQHTTRFKYNSVYLRAVDGNVWHLGAERGSWEKLLVQQ